MTLAAGDSANQPANPYSKLFDRNVDKLKFESQVKTEAEKQPGAKTKKSKGNGKVSIELAEMGEQKTKIYKIVFRNMIGKTLYDANISGKLSKIRKVPEKAQKN